MKPFLLVARREYRQLTSTRSFWITMLSIPLVFVAVSLLPMLFRPPGGSSYVILDQSAKFADAIDRRVELDYQRSVVNALKEYVRNNHLHLGAPESIWNSDLPRLASFADAEQFLGAGGLPAALRRIQKAAPKDVAPFDPPARRLLRAALPTGIRTEASPSEFEQAITPYLGNSLPTADGPRALSIAVRIPAVIDATTQPVTFWSSGRSEPDLVNITISEVQRIERAEALVKAGFDPSAVAEANRIWVPIALVAPQPGTGATRLVVRSVLPLALAYLLLITVIVSGTMMLQGVVEERSNRLIETVLASVSAAEFMRGKLIGVSAVALTIITVWVAFALGGLTFLPGELASALRPALDIFDSPIVGLALAFYFALGYVSNSILFLTIGAMSDSLQDAQGYLMPLIFLLTGPFVLLATGVVQGPGNLLPSILSWIPLYTPFAMLARLGSGVSPGEIVGTAALLSLYVAAEFWLLGRVFRASLLRTGQPPRLRAVLALMRLADPM